jgi:hypothetical protein
MLLAVASVVYLAVVWNWRHRLGLDAFRAVLRRRVTPQATTPLPTGS